jgi:hypothetical protein
MATRLCLPQAEQIINEASTAGLGKQGWAARLDPAAPARRLVKRRHAVGCVHRHAVGWVHHPVRLRRVGAAGPALIDLSDRPISIILIGEALGREIVRTLLGPIGLVLSVPLTTAVGAAQARFARGPARSARAPHSRP